MSNVEHHSANRRQPDPPATGAMPATKGANTGLGFSLGQGGFVSAAVARGGLVSVATSGLASAAVAKAVASRHSGLSAAAVSVSRGPRQAGARGNVSSIFGHDSSEDEGG
jgi:hypothetical protein